MTLKNPMIYYSWGPISSVFTCFCIFCIYLLWY